LQQAAVFQLSIVVSLPESFRGTLCSMLNKAKNDAVSDTTGDATGTTAGIIKIKILFGSGNDQNGRAIKSKSR
jgi:hypothetical protein